MREKVFKGKGSGDEQTLSWKVVVAVVVILQSLDVTCLERVENVHRKHCIKRVIESAYLTRTNPDHILSICFAVSTLEPLDRSLLFYLFV